MMSALGSGRIACMAVLTLGLLASCASPTPSFRLGTAPAPAFDPRHDAWVGADEVVDRMAGADFVVLGEHHDHPEHHLRQAAYLRALLERGRRPAVAFEMLDAGDRAVLDALSGRRERDLEIWRRELAWDERGWPDWELYQPIFEVAVEADLPIVPAQLDKTMRSRLAAEGLGALSDPEVARVAEGPVAAEAQRDLEREIREGHCNMLPDAQVPRMVQVQRIWEAWMAAALHRGATPDGAVLIAGRGHGRLDRGIPWALRQLAPEATTLTLAFVEFPIDVDDPTWGDEHGSDVAGYDLVVPTPLIEREDPCQAFARSHRGAIDAPETPE